MAATNTIGNVLRDPELYRSHPDNFSVGAYGELIIGGGTAFQSAANPSAEVIDGTGVVVGHQFRVTGTLASGTLVPASAGFYLVELDLFDTSDQTASGNVQWDVQYAPSNGASGTFAAMTTTDTAGGGGRMQAIRAAATAKKGVRLAAIQKLNANSAIRAVVTSAAGDVITITEGRLRISKVADINPPSNP